MTNDQVKALLEERLKTLNEARNKIGVTYSRSSERALEWIDGIIAVNLKMLSKIK